MRPKPTTRVRIAQAEVAPATVGGESILRRRSLSDWAGRPGDRREPRARRPGRARGSQPTARGGGHGRGIPTDPSRARSPSLRPRSPRPGRSAMNDAAAGQGRSRRGREGRCLPVTLVLGGARSGKRAAYAETLVERMPSARLFSPPPRRATASGDRIARHQGAPGRRAGRPMRKRLRAEVDRRPWLRRTGPSLVDGLTSGSPT